MQLDSKFESVFAVIESFKQRQRTDFDALVTSTDRRTRAMRKEVLSALHHSLEASEQKLLAHVDSVVGDAQLQELELHKKLKSAIGEWKSGSDGQWRKVEERVSECERLWKSSEAMGRELKAAVEEVKDRARGTYACAAVLAARCWLLAAGCWLLAACASGRAAEYQSVCVCVCFVVSLCWRWVWVRVRLQWRRRWTPTRSRVRHRPQRWPPLRTRRWRRCVPSCWALCTIWSSANSPPTRRCWS
jgi:hypothetical protein